MGQGRLLRMELWAKRNRALVGDSSRMYQVTVSILVWPRVEGESIPTSSEESRLAARHGIGDPGGPAVQAQFWSLKAGLLALALAIVEGARREPDAETGLAQ